MAIEDRLVLKLVPAESPGERVLGPDDLAANLESSFFDCVLELALNGRSVADIHRGAGLHHSAVAGECLAEEPIELGGLHSAALDFELLLRVALVIDVVGRVREDQIRVLAGHEPLDVIAVRRISA